MSAVAIALKHLMAAGVTGDALVAAIGEIDAGINRGDPVAEKRRAYDRERKRTAKSKGIPPETAETAELGFPKERSIQTPSHIPPLVPLFPVDEAVAVWDEMAKRVGLAECRGMNPKRKAMIRARLAEHGEQGWRDAVAAVGRSSFCRGERGEWRANIDFLAKQDKFLKLLEGGFDAKRENKSLAAKLSGDDLNAHRLKTADYYDRTGRENEAADIRRQMGPRHIGNMSSAILARLGRAA